MPTHTSTTTEVRPDDRAGAAATHTFTAPTVREVPRPAPEPPAYAAMW